ncbi:MAG: glycosyltransferase family 39 protein [Terriglobia bacterium]|jgi:hypothetical protein
MIDRPFRNLLQSRAWLLAGMTGVLLRGLPDLRYPIAIDQALFCSMGQRLLRGSLLYRDVWDIKPPGIFYIYALIVKIFGPVPWCVGVVDVLWLMAISLCIFYFARRFVGEPAAALAMVFNAVRHCRQGYVHAGQADTFLMLFVFAAWFLLVQIGPGFRPATDDASAGLRSSQGGQERPIRRRSASLKALARYLRFVAAGLALGAAFWLKYNSALFVPALLLLPVVDFRGWDQGSTRVRMVVGWKRWLTRAWFVGIGFAVAIAGGIAYFWFSGAWPAMRESQFEILPRFAAGHFRWMAEQEGLQSLVTALRLTQFHLGYLTEVMVPVSLLIAWRRREVRFLAPVCFLGLTGYLCAALQGQFNSYYFETCYPFISIFWGYVLVNLWRGFRFARRVFGQQGWSLARAMLWVILASLVFALLSEEGVRIVQQYAFLRDWWRNPEVSYSVYWNQIVFEKLGDKLRIITYVKKNSKPADEVFVWGHASLINFLAQRDSPGRFLYNWPLMADWRQPQWCQELANTLQADRPRYFVVERHDAAPVLTHTELDSEEYLRLRQCPPLTDYFISNYRPAVSYTDFELYELNVPPKG